jgi:hypothetical protein
MDKRARIQQRRLDELERDFYPLLIESLKLCARGRWGLFRHQFTKSLLTTRSKYLGTKTIGNWCRTPRKSSKRTIGSMTLSLITRATWESITGASRKESWALVTLYAVYSLPMARHPYRQIYTKVSGYMLGS